MWWQRDSWPTGQPAAHSPPFHPRPGPVPKKGLMHMECRHSSLNVPKELPLGHLAGPGVCIPVDGQSNAKRFAQALKAAQGCLDRARVLSKRAQTCPRMGGAWPEDSQGRGLSYLCLRASHRELGSGTADLSQANDHCSPPLPWAPQWALCWASVSSPSLTGPFSTLPPD